MIWGQVVPVLVGGHLDVKWSHIVLEGDDVTSSDIVFKSLIVEGDMLDI